MGRALDPRFEEFVNAGSRALLRLAVLLTQDHGHAEDLVQVALLRTHQRWGSLREPAAAHAYAKRVLVTQAASRRRLRSNSELVELPPHDPAAAPESDRYAEREAMTAVLRSLPPRMRAVLVLRYWEDLSEADTAEALGCSVHTVRSQTSRGLTRLRDALSSTPTVPTTRSW